MKQRVIAPPPVLAARLPNAGTTHGEEVAADSESGRDLRMISVDLIDPNPLAPRQIYTQQMISDRADDLRDQGQNDPIHVIPNPNVEGRFIICDGWTRVQACVRHKVLGSLLAEVHSDMSLVESAWLGYNQNECRTLHCDYDRAVFYERLIQAGETAAEIARRRKHSKTQMSFYKAFIELPDSVLEFVKADKDKFSATVAYQLLKLFRQCGERKTVALAAKFAAEDQTVRWLTNQVQASLHPSAHRAPVSSTTMRYANGVYKQRGNDFELTISVEPQHREEFAQALQQLLDKVAIKETEAPPA